jgi:hypothetical protein
VIDGKRDAPSSACAPTEIRPKIGMGTESMVHMKCRDRSLQTENDMQENDRIDPARQSDDQAVSIANVSVETFADE